MGTIAFLLGLLCHGLALGLFVGGDLGWGVAFGIACCVCYAIVGVRLTQHYLGRVR